MFYDNVTSRLFQEEIYPDAPVRVLLANPDREGSETQIENEWISLPTTEQATKEVLGRLGFAKNPYAAEISVVIIPGVDIPELQVPLICDTLRQGTLDELNFFATTFSDQNAEQRAIYCALLECGERTETIKDIINLGWNLDNYEVLPEKTTFAEYGRLMIDTYARDLIPGCYEQFIDYDGIGRYEAHHRNVYIGENMTLEQTERYFLAEYNGREVPEKYRITPAPASDKSRRAPSGPER